MYEIINDIYKWKDCQHCGDEWEYQCYECEKAEEETKEPHSFNDNAVYYEYAESNHRYHGYECGICGKILQTG